MSTVVNKQRSRKENLLSNETKDELKLKQIKLDQIFIFVSVENYAHIVAHQIPFT